MKILAIVNFVDKDNTKESAIHLWRVKRPLEELKKHVDWDITYQRAIIEDFHGLEEDPDEYIKQYGAQRAKELGQYDIVFASYFTSPHIYTILWAAQEKYGTKFILDFDDDLFNPDPSNFAFWKSAGWQGHEFLTIMARVAPYISTTNPDLAQKIVDNSEVGVKTFLLPNYISEIYPEQTIDNGDRVVIGFFGGASHYSDVHDSRLLPALEKLMIKHKNVYVKFCGQPADHYLPRGRYEQVDTAQGNDWPTKRLPSLNLDIAVAPLLDTEFNKHKSNIKWQEATRMGSAFVASNVGAYKPLKNAVLVDNSVDAWYEALETLVLNKKLRNELVAKSKEELKADWRMEDNWQPYKEMFEEVLNG